MLGERIYFGVTFELDFIKSDRRIQDAINLAKCNLPRTFLVEPLSS